MPLAKKSSGKEPNVLSVHSSIFYNAPWSSFNFLNLVTTLVCAIQLVYGFLAFIEAAQTFFIQPWVFLITYVTIVGCLILAMLIGFIGYYVNTASADNAHYPSYRHMLDVTISPAFNVVGFILCTWALTKWLQTYSTGMGDGISGGDPNPHNAATNNNPHIVPGDIAPYVQWIFTMMLFTFTGFIASFLGTRSLAAHAYPEAVRPHTVIADK